MTPSTATPTLIPTGTWSADAVHSKAGFAVKHMGIATVRGEFRQFQGALEIGEDLADARVHGSVNVASVDTGDAQRDAHLRSPDFFDAEAYPEMTFSSTSIEAAGDDAFRITGDLTLHGVTKEIVLDAEVLGTDVDPMGNDRVGLEITGQLSRGDFDMKFNQALGSGNLVVADKVTLALDVSAVRQG
jgi:polyisoprenoid-binding protein YceI